MSPLPPDVYRALAALKAEGVTDYHVIAENLEIPEFEAVKILNAFAWLAWADEQILFDNSSEFSITPAGIEILKTSPRPLSQDGYPVLAPPKFKTIPTVTVQLPLL